MSRELIERLRAIWRGRQGTYAIRRDAGLAANALEAAASRERELERALSHHGITVKPDGTYEYEDNSALSEQPCEWSRTVQDARRYHFLKKRGGSFDFRFTSRSVDELIDAAMAGEEP